MALEQTFKEPCAALHRLQEYLSGVRCTVVEDKPLTGETLLVEELGNAVEDALGWVDEALNAAALAYAAAASGDVETARRALGECGDGLQHAWQHGAAELWRYERLDELLRLGRTRRGEWQPWTHSVKEALEGCQPQLFEINELLQRCWAELTERAGLRTVNVQTGNIGQLALANGGGHFTRGHGGFAARGQEGRNHEQE